MKITNYIIQEILSRRITLGEKYYKDVPRNIIARIIIDNFINCEYYSREIRDIKTDIMGYTKLDDKVVEIKVRYRNVYEVITELCTEYNLEIKIRINDNDEIVFYVTDK